MVPRPPRIGATYYGWHDPEYVANRSRELEIADFRKWFIEHFNEPPPGFQWKRRKPTSNEINDAIEEFLSNGYTYLGYNTWHI